MWYRLYIWSRFCQCLRHGCITATNPRLDTKRQSRLICYNRSAASTNKNPRSYSGVPLKCVVMCPTCDQYNPIALSVFFLPSIQEIWCTRQNISMQRSKQHSPRASSCATRAWCVCEFLLDSLLVVIIYACGASKIWRMDIQIR